MANVAVNPNTLPDQTTHAGGVPKFNSMAEYTAWKNSGGSKPVTPITAGTGNNADVWAKQRYNAGAPLAPGTPVPEGAAGLATKTDPGLTAAEPTVDDQVRQFQEMANKTAAELAKGDYDPAQQERYYNEAKAPIESDFYNQSNQVASYLARQGMGSSQGINISAASTLNNNRAALESQANLKATDLAQELKRRSIIDAFQTETQGMEVGLQNKGINVGQTIAQMQIQAQMEALQKQLDAQSDAGVGSLIGSVLGAGATIGGAAILASDERLKDEVEPTADGVMFRYKNDGTRHYGVLAQEIEDEFPDAVVEKDGVKFVNYGRLYIQRAMRAR